jgi:hypothetical protein
MKRLGIYAFGLWISILLGATAGAAWQEELGRIRIEAGPHTRTSGLVQCQLPQSWRDADHLTLVVVDDDAKVEAQRSTLFPDQLCWMLENPLLANTSREYRVIRSTAAEPSVTCKDQSGKIVVAAKGHPILTYHHETAQPPQGIASLYQRSGFIHPLHTPSGRVVTDDFPPDHAHQHGLFRAWVNTKFMGEKVDFWNQAGKTGDVKHSRLDQLSSGPVFAEFTVHLEHQQLRPESQPRTALHEEWNVRAYQNQDVFVVDLHSKQQAASDSPIQILEYHYGGFAVRGHRDWNADSSFSFLTSEGKDRIEGNHSRPNWVLMTGPVDGEWASSLAMGHPENFRHPQPVRLHPKMPYFCFAPMVLGEFSITQAVPFESRIRILVADGRMTSDEANGYWAEYTEPIQAKVQAAP